MTMSPFSRCGVMWAIISSMVSPAFTMSITRRGFFKTCASSSMECVPTTCVPAASCAMKSSTFEDFGSFSGHAERGVQILVAVVAVIDPVNFTIGQLAVHEEQVGVGLRFGILEVRGYLREGQGLGHRLVGIDLALAGGAFARAGPPEFVGDDGEFRLIVAQAEFAV